MVQDARRLAAALALSAAFLTELCGCKVSIPPQPIDGGGADPNGVAFEHDIQIDWKFPELELLDSVNVQYPGAVSLIGTSLSQELSLQLKVLVEKPHDAEYSQEYLQQVQADSKLGAQDAVLIAPIPAHACAETFDHEGVLTGVTGVCPQDITIVVPSSHPIPVSVQALGDFTSTKAKIPILSVTLLDNTHAQIQNLTGDFKAYGGGPAATLQLDGATGLDLELDSIAKADLKHISGKVHISLAHPTAGTTVSLDGKPITTFPFDRP